ncbi:hypothetical protein ACFPN1_16085 [Lysobacter yangpyeongensis]|uniref:DUF1705 domain-containing protein n=1 Tax=Lysobacter yangpyeongensis TaxID=346182 RepID=A0ABW0SS15_9GAMM
MSREDFIAVASRLFAIYLLYITIRSTPAALQMLSQPDGMGWSALYTALLTGLLLFIGFLWFFPLTIARKLLPVMREPRSETALDSSTALSVGITLIGLWFLASAIADASYWIALLIRVAQTDAIGFEWSQEQIANMVATVVQLAFALVLVLGSSGIKRLIHRYRFGAIPDAR